MDEEGAIEVSLLSESAIGYPNAFSTAVKPSLPLGQPLPSVLGSNGLSGKIQGRLSLGGTPITSPAVDGSADEKKQKDVEFSLNESSLGILDLDAIQSADNSLNQFLYATPPGPHGLHLQLSPGSSTQPSLAGSLASRDSLPRAPPPSTSSVPPPPPKTDIIKDQKLAGGLAPSRAGAVLGTGAPSTRRPVSTASEPKSLPEAATGEESVQTRSTRPATSIGTEHICTEQGSLGDESALGKDFSGNVTESDSSKTLRPSTSPPATNPSSLARKSANSTFNDLLRLSVSQNTLGSSLGLPSELLGSLSGSSHFGSESEGDTVQSALASALEMYNASRTSNGGGLPDVTTEATFSPTQSTRSLPRDPEPSLGFNHLLASPSQSARSLPRDWEPSLGLNHLLTPPVSTRQQVSLSPAGESLEGLPSTYLNPQDLTQATDLTPSFSSRHRHLLHPPDPLGGVASGTTLTSSSLADSLAEFAGVLGSPLERREGEELGVGEWQMPDGKSMEEGMYNPFDSHDGADFEQEGIEFEPEGVEFQQQDTSSFLAQLEKDEDNVKKYDMTPSSRQVSFERPGSTVGGAGGTYVDTSGELSIASYFEKKSNALGDLSALKLPPKERPHFTDTPEHVILSPSTEHTDRAVLTPSSSANIAKATPIKPANGDLDETLKPDQHAAEGNGRSLKQVPPLSLDALTPAVVSHPPLPVDLGVPKFVLRDSSSPGGNQGSMGDNRESERTAGEDKNLSLAPTTGESEGKDLNLSPAPTIQSSYALETFTQVSSTTVIESCVETAISATITSPAVTSEPVAVPTALTKDGGTSTKLLGQPVGESGGSLKPSFSATKPSVHFASKPTIYSPTKSVKRYSPIGAHPSPSTPGRSDGGSGVGKGGEGSSPSASSSLVRGMQENLAKLRGELEESCISAVAMMGRSSTSPSNSSLSLRGAESVLSPGSEKARTSVSPVLSRGGKSAFRMTLPSTSSLPSMIASTPMTSGSSLPSRTSSTIATAPMISGSSLPSRTSSTIASAPMTSGSSLPSRTSSTITSAPMTSDSQKVAAAAREHLLSSSAASISSSSLSRNVYSGTKETTNSTVVLAKGPDFIFSTAASSSSVSLSKELRTSTTDGISTSPALPAPASDSPGFLLEGRKLDHVSTTISTTSFSALPGARKINTSSLTSHPPSTSISKSSEVKPASTPSIPSVMSSVVPPSKPLEALQPSHTFSFSTSISPSLVTSPSEQPHTSSSPLASLPSVPMATSRIPAALSSPEKRQDVKKSSQHGKVVFSPPKTPRSGSVSKMSEAKPSHRSLLVGSSAATSTPPTATPLSETLHSAKPISSLLSSSTATPLPAPVSSPAFTASHIAVSLSNTMPLSSSQEYPITTSSPFATPTSRHPFSATTPTSQHISPSAVPTSHHKLPTATPTSQRVTPSPTLTSRRLTPTPSGGEAVVTSALGMRLAEQLAHAKQLFRNLEQMGKDFAASRQRFKSDLLTMSHVETPSHTRLTYTSSSLHTGLSTTQFSPKHTEGSSPHKINTSGFRSPATITPELSPERGEAVPQVAASSVYTPTLSTSSLAASEPSPRVTSGQDEPKGASPLSSSTLPKQTGASPLSSSTQSFLSKRTGASPLSSSTLRTEVGSSAESTLPKHTGASLPSSSTLRTEVGSSFSSAESTLLKQTGASLLSSSTLSKRTDVGSSFSSSKSILPQNQTSLSSSTLPKRTEASSGFSSAQSFLPRRTEASPLALSTAQFSPKKDLYVPPTPYIVATAEFSPKHTPPSPQISPKRTMAFLSNIESPSVLSPSPRRAGASSADTPFPGVASIPSPSPKRAPLIDSSKLRMADTHTFKEICCIGTSLVDLVPLSSTSERWLQLTFVLSQVRRDGVPLRSSKREGKNRVFSIPERIFVSPHQSELLKVTFHPEQSGSYEAELCVRVSQVTSTDQLDVTFTSSITLKAVAEDPQVELRPQGHAPSRDSGGLDFGVLVGGTSVGMPLILINRGRSKIPLNLSVTSEKPLSRMYFGFKPLPHSLLLSSPHTSHTPPFHTLSLTLPPQPRGDQEAPQEGTLETHSLELFFTAPRRVLSDSLSGLGPAEEISAQLEMSVGGERGCLLSTLPLRAIVGVARLSVPKSLQVISLSCPLGKAASRDVPVKNTGNISLRVGLTVGGGDSSPFTVAPTALSLKPNEESKVCVTFDPPTAPFTSEEQVIACVEPRGPSYELRVHGTTTQPTPSAKKGMLSCNRRYLYWGGVTLGESKQLKVVLYNSFSTPVPVSLSIRHSQSPFQLEVKELVLLPDQEHPVMITFFPFSTSVSITALDIFDKKHSKKYRVPLCGYGGVSRLEVGGVSPASSTTGESLDIGEVKAGRGIKFNVLLYNSGPRAAFVRATCCNLDKPHHAPLPDNHAHLVPSRVVIPPHTSTELPLFYRPTKAEEEKCRVGKAPLARLVLEYGDEVMRQKLVWAIRKEVAEGGGGGERNEGAILTPTCREFVKEFAQNSKITSEMDLIGFNFEDVSKEFTSHLTVLPVVLMGSAKPVYNPIRQVERTAEVVRTPSPKALRRPLSPSYTPLLSGHTATRQAEVQSTLRLAKIHTGQTAEGFLDVKNPFSAPLHWELSSSPPYIQDSSGSQLRRANRQVFTVQSKSGTVPPNDARKVKMTFMTKESGIYSQIWSLKMYGPVGLKTNEHKISVSGEAMVSPSPPVAKAPLGFSQLPSTTAQDMLHSHDPRKQQNVADWLHNTHNHKNRQENTSPGRKLQSKKVSSPKKKCVYLSDSVLEFPRAAVGSQVTVKVRVCNRDNVTHHFTVINPTKPFKVNHLNFSLEPRQCARLPVQFTPTLAGRYDAILALQTAAGHQTFAQLRGSAF